MIDIKYTLDPNGYVNNFAITGDLPNSKLVSVNDFDTLNYDCYKEVNSKLVWDEEKYQRKINPAPIGPQPPTLEEQLAEKDAQIIKLKEEQFKTQQMTIQNTENQQELIELLMMMGVI